MTPKMLRYIPVTWTKKLLYYQVITSFWKKLMLKIEHMPSVILSEPLVVI